MLKYTEKFDKRVFIGDTTKDAYLKACKWYATNIMAKGLEDTIIVNYKKTSDCEVIMTLSIQLGQEIKDKHCTICHEAHSAFFLNNKEDCDRCNMLAFHKRVHESMATKKSYFKDLLKDK